MDKRLVLLGIPTLLLIALIGGIGTLSQAHAAGSTSGTVCLLDSSAVISVGSGPCQSFGSYTFNGPYPSTPQSGPTELRVGVYASDSNGLDGFQIILLSNSSILAPAGVDLTGTVLLGTPQILSECLSNVIVQGTTCSSADNVNTLEFAASSALGEPLTTAPTTGLLFTAIYNIVSTAPAGGISIGFQTGCGANTSISDGTCVTLANGSTSGTPDSETVQGATFDNSGGNPGLSWYYETASSNQITVPLNSVTGNSVNLTATAPNGLPTLGSTSVTFSSSVTSGFAAPTFGGNPTFLCSSFSGAPASCSTSLSLSTSKGGTYFVTVYVGYVGDNCPNGGPCSTTYSLVGTSVIKVNVQAVAWTINSPSSAAPQIMNMADGASNPLNIIFTAQSLGGYTGNITYQTNTLSDGGTGISFSYPAPFILGSGQTISQTIVATASNQGTALYQAALVTSAPTLTNQSSAVLTIHVTGFGIIAASGSVTFPAFSSISDSITLQGLPASSAGFAGKVALSKIVSGPVTVTCPASLTITAGGTVSGTCSVSSNVAGSYTLVITATGGTNNAITNSTTIQVTVTNTPPSFNIAASPTSATGTINIPLASKLTITSQGGLTGTVTLSYSSSPSGATCGFSNTGIPLPSGTSTVSCTSPIPGTFIVKVKGVDGSHTASASITLTLTDFSVIANPATVNTSAGVGASSAITIGPLNGFTDTVTLSDSIVPSGLTCSLSPTSVAGGSGSSTLSCTGIGGTYAVTVTGTDGTASHSATLTFNVQDFTLNASPSAINVPIGPPAGTSMITVVALGGFTGTVLLTAQSPVGFSTIFVPSTVSIAGTSLLTIGVSPPAVPGVYLVNVTGTSGGLSHTVTITVTVTAASGVLPPVFTQGTWEHRFSLSRYADTQVWRFGVQNNSTDTTIYFSVTISGIDTSGTMSFTLSTGVFTEQPLKNLSQLPLSQGISASELGETFSFTMVIHWDTAPSTNPADLAFTSTLAESGIPTSGSFTVLP